MSLALIIGYVSVFLLLISALFLVLAYFFTHARKSLSHGSFLRIHIKERSLKEAKSIAATIFRELHTLKIPFALEAAVEALGEQIYLHLITGSHVASDVQKKISALGHEASVGDGHDYALWLHNQQEAYTAQLNHTRNYLTPLQKTSEHTETPFHHFLHVLSTLKPIGEAALLQFIVIPTEEGVEREVKKLYRMLGSNPDSKLLSSLDKQMHISRETLDHLSDKISQPLFATHGRVLVSTDNEVRAQEILSAIETGLKDIDAGACINGVCLRAPKKKSVAVEDIIQRLAKPEEGMLLNANELSELFHFVPEGHLPKLSRL